jgi:hypothetical protein
MLPRTSRRFRESDYRLVLQQGWKKEADVGTCSLVYGKTAVAGTVKEKLDIMGLGFDNPVGAIFFWRTSPERNSPALFVITLAYQFAGSIPELQPHVDAVIKSKPGIVTLALECQLDELTPFKSLGNLEKEPIRLIIVDWIDECITSDRESCMGKKYDEDEEAELECSTSSFIKPNRSHLNCVKVLRIP